MVEVDENLRRTGPAGTANSTAPAPLAAHPIKPVYAVRPEAPGELGEMDHRMHTLGGSRYRHRIIGD